MYKLKIKYILSYKNFIFAVSIGDEKLKTPARSDNGNSSSPVLARNRPGKDQTRPVRFLTSTGPDRKLTKN